MNTEVVDPVAAALIPDAHDGGMPLTHLTWAIAHAEAELAQAALQDAHRYHDMGQNTRTLANYLVAMRDYGRALLVYADAETALHTAMMTADEAANLRLQIEAAERFIS